MLRGITIIKKLPSSGPRTGGVGNSTKLEYRVMIDQPSQDDVIMITLLSGSECSLLVQLGVMSISHSSPIPNCISCKAEGVVV